MTTFFSIQTQDHLCTIEMHRPADTQSDVDALLCEMDKVLVMPSLRKIQWLIDMSKMKIYFFNVQWNLVYYTQHAISARMVHIRKKVERIAIHRQPDLISMIIVGCINSVLSNRKEDATLVQMFKTRKECALFLNT